MEILATWPCVSKCFSLSIEFYNKLITAERKALSFRPQYRYSHCGDFFLFDVEIRKRKIEQKEGWERLLGVTEHQALEEQNLFPTIPRQAS